MREHMNKQMDLLYKYRPFDRKSQPECKRTLKMLRQSNVWMATPTSFNDPFDCRPEILRNEETEQRNLQTIVQNHLRAIKAALRKHQKLMDKEGQPLPRRALVELRRLLESRRPNNVKYQALNKRLVVPPCGEMALELLRSTLNKIGVLSLTANPAEMLMWAHYASQHSGFCLGFEPSVGSLLRDDTHTKAVNYMDQYPKLDLHSLKIHWSVVVQDGPVSESTKIEVEEPNLQAVIYSKSKKWQHEKEWRVLVAEGGVPVPYPGPLRKVIFGLHCEPDSRRLIERTVKEASNESTIQFAEIKSKVGSFDLDIHDL
jgi:hypothetical protein